ncbi:MAG: ABC transporter permease, partial [Ardenticatenia bacterium]|nr:ABC transporter permease [Ardenticatenia bacterium]
RLNPWAIILVSILWAALLVGGDQIQIVMGLPASMALVLQGAILFLMLGGNIFTSYRLYLVRSVPSISTSATGE